MSKLVHAFHIYQFQIYTDFCDFVNIYFCHYYEISMRVQMISRVLLIFYFQHNSFCHIIFLKEKERSWEWEGQSILGEAEIASFPPQFIFPSSRVELLLRSNPCSDQEPKWLHPDLALQKAKKINFYCLSCPVYGICYSSPRLLSSHLKKPIFYTALFYILK